MEQITEVVKKHPVAIGVGVLILVLLVAKGGSGGGNSAAVLQSQASAQQTDVALSNINATTQRQRDQLTAAIYAKTIDANAANNASDQQSMVQLMLGAFGYRATMQQLQDQHDIAATQLADSTSIAAQSLQGQINMHVTDVNAGLSALAQKLNLQHYGIDVASQNMPQMLAYQTAKDQIAASEAASLASINGQTAQAIASINTAAARTTANANANSQNVDTLGNIVSMGSDLLSFFG